MRRLAMLAAATALLVLSACGDDDPGGIDDGACPPNLTSVTATVTPAGDVPRFDWSPRCPVALVLVEGENGDTWVLSAADSLQERGTAANVIRPPLSYGETRAGAESQHHDVMVAGQQYDLVLWRVLPAGSTAQCEMRFGDACLVAVETFTR